MHLVDGPRVPGSGINPNGDTDMNVTQTVRRLRDDAFLEELRRSLASWADDVDPALVEETVAWADGVRGGLADLVELVADPDDAAMACAVKLIELKAGWIGINTKLNYTAVQGGTVETADALRGAATSALVDLLEAFLPGRNVEAFHAFLGSPLTSRALRVLDDVWNDAVKPRPAFPPARKAKGVDSARNRKNRGWRLAA